MNKRLIKFIHSKASRRVVSGITALVMLFSVAPFSEIIDDITDIRNAFVASAEGEDDTGVQFKHDPQNSNTVTISIAQLVEYSKDFRDHKAYHKNDDLVIKHDAENAVFSESFIPLGDEFNPFGGSVKIESDVAKDIVMNIDNALFDWVYDDVVIFNTYNTENQWNISREYNPSDTDVDKTTPILANHVKHRNGGAKWNINLTQPSDDTTDTLEPFGGLIGTMETDASLELNVWMNQTANDTDAATIMGSGDLGFACGEMKSDSSLSFTLVTDRGVGDITTTSGNVGGLVGSMASGASFTYVGANPQTVTQNSKNIKTTGAGGYAGGIVGKNVGGTVALASSKTVTTENDQEVVTYTYYDSSSHYPIGQTIEGKAGCGSIYGYYEPTGTGSVTIDTSKYSVSGTYGGNTFNCQVNGSGNVGGLIGELVCTNDVAITGSEPVSTSHASTTAATNYGGLVGKYKNDASHTLTVDPLSITTANTGKSTFYGGCIGTIDTTAASYAVFNNPTVVSSDAGLLTYGGLVASADNAFVDVKGASVTASGCKGGGLVGRLDHGVLRMDGAITLSGAAPSAPSGSDPDETQKVGKIVGWRDDALVFAAHTCSLTKPTNAVDDIGAWGQVIVFGAEDKNTVSGSTIEQLNSAEVLRVDESTHAVTIAAPTTTISGEADFAKDALCFQIDASKNNFVSFASGSAYTYSTIKSTAITLAADVDLSGTGFTGLTRDNDVGTENGTDKCTYSSTFSGKTTSNGVDTIHSITFGGEKVYRHTHNGLFAIADGAKVEYTTFKGTIEVNACKDMYVGAAAAVTKNSFMADYVDVGVFNSDSTAGDPFTVKYAGASSVTIGGIAGQVTTGAPSTTITSPLSVTNVRVNCNITDNNAGTADPVAGGVIGKIADSAAEKRKWTFSDVRVTGSITNSKSVADNRIGGLAAVISGYSASSTYPVRNLDLTNINIDDLDITVNAAVNGTVGGTLGYTWKNAEVKFKNVSVNNGSSITNTGTAAGVDFAGLVYNGTGYWYANKTNGANSTVIPDIAVNSLALVSNNAQSFGMIVNKGWYSDSDMADNSSSAIYLELQDKDAYYINSSNVSFKTSADSAMTIPVFDELVAYSAYYTGSGASKVAYDSSVDDLYILKNKQGVISVQPAVTAGGGLAMDGKTASGTYTPATEYGKQMNPYSRYYYNLYNICQRNKNSSASDADKLMAWAARWYAHGSIKYAITSFVNTSTIQSGSYDMTGYSWYPVNIDTTTLTINGAFKLANREFELSEAAAETASHAARTSLYSSGTTQHYLMHSALINDVKGKLVVGTTDFKLQGSVPQIRTSGSSTVGGKYSGALVLGTVKGSDATDDKTAKVTTTNVVLDGIYVYNFDLSDDYAPLLINKSADYSTLTISGVKVDSNASYKTNTGILALDGSARAVGGYPKIATSLIGNAGADKNSKNVNINFTNIQLDGRNINLSLTDLDSAYHTDVTLFTKATLLNKLTFSSGKGTYNYTYADDWGAVSENDPTFKRFVTYGQEVGFVNASDSTPVNQYPNLERHYLNGAQFTNPTSAAATASDGYAATFRSSYIPYVATKYSSTNCEYQLEVNHSTTQFGGCGTYNDPYIITAGKDLTAIFDILYSPADGQRIYLPTKKSNNKLSADTTLTWHTDHDSNDSVDDGHIQYICKNQNFYRIDSSGHAITDTTDANYELVTAETVRKYVAGAYYKLDPASNDDTITLDPDVNDPTSDDYASSFKGLGVTVDSGATEYVKFRGVIVGTGNEIIVNKTQYPLIAISNGSVCKDFMITVDRSTTDADTGVVTPGTISLEQGSAEVFPTVKSYGAVFGAVMGGDNIIDNVRVSFDTNTNIVLSGKKAQLIPVGGYVGVVVNGGVIFRGMEGKSGIEGLSPTGTTVRSGSETRLITKEVTETVDGQNVTKTVDNMKWLYVNPIIGRVINGYAVTEASAYRPFEDGSRTYGDGTVEYWLETKSGNTITSSISTSAADKSKAVGVTMKNGNKHYSITDIDKNSKGQLVESSKAITVSDAQAFFLMSLIVNSGISKNALGFVQNRNYTFRNADYDEIGPSATAAGDYNTAQKDKNNATPELVHYMTGSRANLADTSVTVTLSKKTYYLPDGYKGIGNIFQNAANYRMKISKLTGNEATISQNTNFFHYHSDFDSSYKPNSGTASDYGIGLGLINFQTVNSNAEDIILKGNVKADMIDYNWAKVDTNLNYAHITYNNNVNSYMISVGSLFGCINEDQTINSVGLQNVDVRGVRYVGGMIEASSNKKITITNTNKSESNRIKVHSGLIAGGVIGKLNANVLDLDFNNCSFSITEVISECSGGVTNNYYNYGVGGIVGMCRSKIGEQANPGCGGSIIKNVIIGSEENDAQCATVKCEKANIYTGGLVGIFNRAYLTLSNCKIYNMNVESKFAAGGLIGHWATAGGNSSTAEQRQSIISNTTISGTIPGKLPEIKSTGSEKYCSAGGFLGSGKDDMNNVVILNSGIDNYKITGNVYAGGAIGSWGDSSTSDTNKWKSATAQFNNFKINDCTIGATGSSGAAGGLLGNLNGGENKTSGTGPTLNTYNFRLYGYNILSKNLTITGTNKGYICGRNGRTNTNDIKIIGYSRQDSESGRMIANLVGTAVTDGSTASDVPYGNNGYVVFADFNDAASTAPNTLFSGVGATNNVTTMRSATTMTADGSVVYGNYDTNAAANTSAGHAVTGGVSKNENYPYVTSSPRFNLDSTNYLTGDGVGNATFANSTFSKIRNDTTAKKYTAYARYSGGTCSGDLTQADIDEISEHYKSSTDYFSAGTPFKMLVIDNIDRESTTALINNYINVLANTSFNYADTSGNVYNIAMYKAEWNGTAFSISSDAASGNLKRDASTKRFYIKADDVDSGKKQFTILDVQFYDPSSVSGTKKVAYHLYIPVYVEQLLRFKFKAALASNTDYYTDAYSDNIDYLFENLGTPVTLKFEYEYKRTPSEWAEAINGGACILTNYYKTLVFKTDTSAPFPTKLVLVDSNNNDKHYYYDLPSSNPGTLDLYDFTDGSGTHYNPASLQSILGNNSFVVERDDTNGMLAKVSAASDAAAVEAGALIKIGSDYYKLATTETEKYRVLASVPVVATTTVSELMVTNDPSEATVKYNNVYYKPYDGSDGVQTYKTEEFASERYYLSFYTTNTETTDTYKIGLTSKASFADKREDSGIIFWEQKGWRANEVLTNENKTAYILLGDFYENRLFLSVDPSNPKMGEDNYYLTVHMTSQVKLKGNTSQQQRTASDMRGHESTPIHQTFTMLYEKYNTDDTTERGIDLEAGGEIGRDGRYYGIGAGPISHADFKNAESTTVSGITNITNDSGTKFISGSQNFIELKNDKNLISMLSNASNQYAVTLHTKFIMMYDWTKLGEQFPARQNESTDPYGAKVIGYSKISSSLEGAAYSNNSYQQADTTVYYTNDREMAKLTYDVKPTYSDSDRHEPSYGPYGGKYSYLGINGIETGDDADSLIESTALYDLRNIQNPGDYIELTLSLSPKGAYIYPAVGDPQPPAEAGKTVTPLDIREYFTELKIYGQTDSDVLYTMSTDTDFNSADSDGTIIRFRVARSQLRVSDDAKLYEIPITYKVKTGDDNFNSNGGLKYSNYKVSVTAATYQNTSTQTYDQSTYAFDHLIYTNAKLDPSVL